MICFQESSISEDSMQQLLYLDVYSRCHVNAMFSTHGGVVTYYDNSYDVTIKGHNNISDICHWLLEI